MKKSMSNKSADSDLGNSQSSTSGTSSPEDTKTTRSKSKQGEADSADFTIPQGTPREDVVRALLMYLGKMKPLDDSLPQQVSSGYFMSQLVAGYTFTFWLPEMHSAILTTIAEEGARMLREFEEHEKKRSRH